MPTVGMLCSFHPRPILLCDLKLFETGLEAAFFLPSFLELKKHKDVIVLQTTESWMLCKQFRFQKHQEPVCPNKKPTMPLTPISDKRI
jgi:hypothetical protein